MKTAFILIIILFFLPILVFAESIQLEPITIEKSTVGESTEGIDYIYQDNIPFFSIEEIIDYSSSVDLRKRSPFGIQQDLSLRGSIFEDNTITLDGIRINDPQTGHFNLELPLTSADLEEVEIHKNLQKVNFVLRKPKKEGLLLRTTFGQHALREQLLSLNFGLGEVNNRISIEHKISSGGRQDTDFEVYNFSSHSLWAADNGEVEFLFGSTKRDFGADSFYSSFFPFEEEHITQRFFMLRGELKNDFFDWNNTAYFRRHTDHFILNRNNPSFYENFHKTYVYGYRSEFDFANDMFLGFDVSRETITSTNLNKHARLRKGLLAGIREKRIGDFVFDISGGLDYYQDWEYLDNAHLGLGYFLKENTKLRFAFDRFWRVPSFTELYYVAPTNIGNKNLEVQKTNNFELGLDYIPWENLDLSFSIFRRDQSNTIDWVKNNAASPWMANNVGEVKAYGFDVYSELKFDDCTLQGIGLGYTYLTLDKDNPYKFSKYVFDYGRHKLVSNFRFDIKGVLLNTIINFANPIDRGNYTTVDLRLEKKIGDFAFIIEGINIFNKDYDEMNDIEGTGRWYKASLAYTF